jgi:hypothetical protein
VRPAPGGVYELLQDGVQRVEDALVVDPLSTRPVTNPADEDDAYEKGP